MEVFMADLKEEIALLTDEVISLRREIHANPELGFKEFKTSALIEEYLNDIGLDRVQTNVAKTGVIGILYGNDTSRTVLLRADMDALPIEELNEIPYKSKNPGVMHACGHDGHVAMLLVAAKVLSKHRNELKGNVKFVFQPSEEKAPGGAVKMIEEGVLDNPHVDYAFGIHLGNIFEKGSIALKEGVFMAEADSFKINVYGTGGHAAYPHLSVDPIIIASNIVLSLQTVVSREINPIDPVVVTLGKICSGDAFNVIPEKAEMLGTVRTLDRKISEIIPEKIERIASNIASAYRGRSELEYEFGYPPLINNAEETKFVKRIAESIIGKEKILDAPISMGGEDMAYFLQKVPGAFFWLGSMNREKGLDKPHHSQYFDFDESVLPIGVEFHVKIAAEIFNK
jgi:amidohydrolase